MEIAPTITVKASRHISGNGMAFRESKAQGGCVKIDGKFPSEANRLIHRVKLHMYPVNHTDPPTMAVQTDIYRKDQEVGKQIQKRNLYFVGQL